MHTVPLGNSGIDVTPICLGTWNMAGDAGWGPDDDERAVALIHHALDSGCNFLDTARGYGRGHAETVVGKAIKGRRDQVVVATKMLHCPPAKVRTELEASLACLDTDYIDLYICHWPRPSLPLEPFFEALAAEREAGRIRAIGVSNFNLHQMETAARYGVVSLQPPMSILWRFPDAVRLFCHEQGIAVTPYSPLAQGLLTGRYTAGDVSFTGIRSRNHLFSEEILPDSLAVARKVDELAAKLGCTSSQVALAWLLRTTGITTVIVGASRPEQWDQNLGALTVQIPDEDYADLDQAGRAVWERVGTDEAMWGWKPS
jgi:aryl-alcohol dehydrogenase-like predicted oxidoreductase